MAEPKSTTKATAEDVAAEKVPAPAADEPSFTLERIQAESYDFVGYPPHVVAGAFHGEPPTREVTVADAKARIRAWLKAPEQTDQQES